MSTPSSRSSGPKSSAPQMSASMTPDTSASTRPNMRGKSAARDVSQHSEFRRPKCDFGCESCMQEWPCLGQRMVHWFDDFYSAVVAVGTLGAGFTFSVIFSTLDDRRGTLGTKDTELIRHFLIIAWLLFVLAVAVASVCAAFFRFMTRHVIEGFNRFGDLMNIVASISSLVLQLLIIGAFIMSARALRRYDEDAGRASVVVTSIIGGVLVAGWFAMLL